MRYLFLLIIPRLSPCGTPRGKNKNTGNAHLNLWTSKPFDDDTFHWINISIQTANRDSRT